MAAKKKKAGIEVRRVPLEDLHLDPANVRTHSERNVDAIAASLARFGQQKPIVVDGDNVVRAGNGTVEAAKSLGWDSLDVAVTKLSGSDATAYAITDNRTSELAEWDESGLVAQLDALQREDEELFQTTGFDDADLGAMMDRQALEAGGGGGEEDAVPETPDDPVTKPGDIWSLGNHRLLCGDSCLPVSFERLGVNAADIVITDPPYGVEYVGKTADALTIDNDSAASLADLLTPSLGAACAATKEGGVWYVFAPPGPQFLDFALALRELGIWRQTLVWEKDKLVLGRSDFHYRHEPIFYGWREGAAHRAPETRTNDSILSFGRPRPNLEHPTMKPLGLLRHLILLSSARGETVLDPFGGSGSTLLAAEHEGRVARTIELSPGYCDVIVERWQNLTGEKATREKS